MNFSNVTAVNYTGTQEVTDGVFAVIVRGVAKWEGASTAEEAEARLSDYVL